MSVSQIPDDFSGRAVNGALSGEGIVYNDAREYYVATREDLEGLRKNMESIKIWVTG